ncbi:MAG: hypothetical protein ACYS47_12275 [Planctomycetota bacterium]|jgi:hypothetical protein
MKYAFLGLAALSLFLFVAGCGGGDDTPSAEEGAGGGPKSLTPGETVSKYLDAFKEGGGGVAAAGEHMTEKAKTYFLALEKKEGKEGFPTVLSFEIGKECIEADSATVEIHGKFLRGGKERERAEMYVLKMEGEAWKVFKLVGEGKEQDFEKAKLDGDR